MSQANKLTFQPQEGPQTQFLASPADIVIYGGAAGSGKTHAILLDALRYHEVPGATIGIFRRDRARLTNPGAIWDESQKIFSAFGAKPNQQFLKWTFPSSATVSMHGLQYKDDVHKFHGSQIGVIIFDELTEFEEYQFWYMLSRNRTDAPMKAYIRASCNPDADSWVRELLKWYLQPDGYPDPAKTGVIRYFCRLDNQLYWANTKQALVDQYNVDHADCMSFTFIAATIEDNQILLQNNPNYMTALRALPEVEKQRLLYGNWNIKAGGTVFKQEDFKVFTRPPPAYQRKIITCDTAQKTKQANDYTVMQAWIKHAGAIYLIDQVRGKFEYPELKIMFKAFCAKHRDASRRYVEEAVSGTALIQDLRREGIQLDGIIRNKDKYTRAYDCQGWVKDGFVYLNAVSDYYSEFVSEANAFNSDMTHAHDDQIDCMMDAIQKLLIDDIGSYNGYSYSDQKLSSEIV